MSLPDGGRMSTRIFVCPRSPVGEPPTSGREGADLWGRYLFVAQHPNVRLWRPLAGLW